MTRTPSVKPPARAPCRIEFTERERASHVQAAEADVAGRGSPCCSAYNKATAEEAPQQRHELARAQEALSELIRREGITVLLT